MKKDRYIIPYWVNSYKLIICIDENIGFSNKKGNLFMRRANKEIKGKEKIMFILNHASICRIAFNDLPYPYIVPVHFVCEKSHFYFHSACEGRKIDLIKKDGKICFETDQQVEIIPNENACNFETKYESVIGTGISMMVNDEIEKKRAMLRLMEKYTGKDKWEIPPEALKKTTVIKVNILDVTGKSSGY